MEKDFEKRIEELASRASSRGIYTETHFLTEGEQTALKSMRLPTSFSLEGGFSEAERCIAVFGNEEEFGYPWESSLAIVRICAKDEKFADAFTHRDFLGAVLNLGIKREVLGDLILWENRAYLVVLESMVPLLTENLSRVRHTAVKVERCSQLPEGAYPVIEEKTVVAASARLDAVIAAVWDLSRTQAKGLVEKEKVSIFGALISDPARTLREGERVSVRGYGRFYFDGESGETRSGRSRVRVRVFV